MPILGLARGQTGLTSATFPIAVPQLPSSGNIEIGFNTIVGVSRSPYTGSRQTFRYPAGEWLTATIDLPPMKECLARTWCAWLALLRGQDGTFLAGDTSLPWPRGSINGTPVVDGAVVAMALTLPTRGWARNASLVLRSGDWVQLGSGLTQRLYMNLLDVNSDDSGNAVLNIFPCIRPEGAADGQQLVVANTQGYLL